MANQSQSVKKGLDLRRKPKATGAEYAYLRLSGFEDRFQGEFMESLFIQMVSKQNIFTETAELPGRIVLWNVKQNETRGQRKRGVHKRQAMEEWLLSIPRGSKLYIYSTANLACPDARNLYDMLEFLKGRQIQVLAMNEDELEDSIQAFQDEDGGYLVGPDPSDHPYDRGFRPIEVTDEAAMTWIRRMARNESSLAGTKARLGVAAAIKNRSKKPGRQRTVTEDQAETIFELTNKGMTQMQIAEHLSVSQATVSRYLNETELTDDQMKQANKLRAKGLTLFAIGKTLGVTETMIIRYFQAPESKGSKPYKRKKVAADRRRTSRKFMTPEELAAQAEQRRTAIAEKVDATRAAEAEGN